MFHAYRTAKNRKKKFERKSQTHLNIKMKRINNEKNIATLSIVRNMTKSCRRRFGINRTNLSIRSRRNVLNTDSPEFPEFEAPSLTKAWHNSTALWMMIKKMNENWECQDKESVLISISNTPLFMTVNIYRIFHRSWFNNKYHY